MLWSKSFQKCKEIICFSNVQLSKQDFYFLVSDDRQLYVRGNMINHFSVLVLVLYVTTHHLHRMPKFHHWEQNVQHSQLWYGELDWIKTPQLPSHLVLFLLSISIYKRLPSQNTETENMVMFQRSCNLLCR